MSRSERKSPFFGVCCGSDTDDRRIARRMVRRTQDRYLQGVSDYDAFLIPHYLECSHSEKYSWSTDGGPIYWGRGGRWHDSFSQKMMRK
jgi:hypothetical protein